MLFIYIYYTCYKNCSLYVNANAKYNHIYISNVNVNFMRVLSSDGYSYVTAVISHILYIITVTSYIYYMSRLLHHIHHDR